MKDIPVFGWIFTRWKSKRDQIIDREALHIMLVIRRAGFITSRGISALTGLPLRRVERMLKLLSGQNAAHSDWDREANATFWEVGTRTDRCITDIYDKRGTIRMTVNVAQVRRRERTPA